MTINLTMPSIDHELKPRITVVGVGGAGGNAVNNMIQSQLEGVEFLVCNTDAQALEQSLAERRLQLGTNTTQGLGAGSRPELGRAAAEEVIDEILEHLHGSHMVFITAGMGGGTGTGAGPVIAEACRNQGILTVGVVTKPFHFEGTHRMRLADAGIEELQQFVDTLIVIPNQNLFRIANEKTTFADAFKMADDVLHSGVRGVTDLMVRQGLVNLDFADIRTVMAEMGKAMMGTGEADGDKRAIDAADAAISNPLLDDMSMKGAKGVLINITGGMDMTLFEVDEAANRIRNEVDPDANIIFGATFDEAMEGRMRVSIVATGIQEEGQVRAPIRGPANLSLVATRHQHNPAPAAAAGYADAPAIAHPVTAEATEAAADLVPEMEHQATGTSDARPIPPISAARPVGAAYDAPAPAVARMAMSESGEEPTVARRQPAPQPQDAFIAPAPADTKRMPPRGAVEAYGAQPQRQAAPAPQAAPAARDAEADRPRGSTLFSRVTGLSRNRPAAQPVAQPRQQAPQAAQQPRVSQTPPQVRPPQPQAEAPQRPQQPTLTRLSPTDRMQPAAVEEDLLDIPAFLRRQAN